MKKTILFVAAFALASVAFAAKDKQHHDVHSSTKALEREVSKLKEEVSSLKVKFSADEKADLIKQITEPYARGSAVVTSPLIGIREAYDASDLLVNLPSVNEDLLLLKQKQSLNAHMLSKNIMFPRRPILDISGAVEGRVIIADNNNDATTTDFDLNRAQINAVAEIEPAVTAAMIVSYENGSLPDMSRVNNSRIKLDRGFITIGNLDKLPLYFTLGQVFVPFGDYSSYMVTLPMTNLLGKTKQRAAILGFSQGGLYGQVYGFQGDTYVYNDVDTFKRGGVNLGYGFQHGKFSGDLGAGYTGNIAESAGMQVTGLPLFDGFEKHEVLAKRVPAIDLHARLSFGEAGSNQFDIAGEYIGATEKFDQKDLMFDGHGAKPSALDLEAQYEFKVMGKPSSISVGYGKTQEALAINLPESSYYAAGHISIFKDTIESIEYRHDKYYGSKDFGSGGQGLVIHPEESKSSNIVTMQLGVYF